MVVGMVLFMTSIAVFPYVAATNALLSLGRHDANQPATQSVANSTSASTAAGMPADVGAANASNAPATLTAMTVAPQATSVAAASNFVTYKPDEFYEKEFASDSNNPLEELSFSASYPTSRPLNASGTATGTVEAQAANSTPTAAVEASKEVSKEATKAEGTNASAVQLTKPEKSLETSTATETTAAAKSADVSPGEDAAPQSTCTTRKDARVAAWFSETAPEGSPCVFGVDGRDEGSHCIFEDGKYGSHGWCYTAEDASTWGSCDGGCPLHGSAAAVASKIDVLADAVGALKSRISAASAAKAASQSIPGASANVVLMQQNETLLQRGRNSEKGPIDWIRSWFTDAELNASAQIAVSTDKDSANSTKRGQVVAVPLQSQLLQESHRSAAPSNQDGPATNSSAMELSEQKQELSEEKQDTEGHDATGIVAVKLQSQLLQKHGAPKSKETGAVVAVKLQSQLLQKKSGPTSKERKTSLMHAHKKRKATKKGTGNKTKKGVVVVKLQSQL